MAPEHIAVFVGSGISLDSDAPCVDQLTQRVLTKAWIEHSSTLYYPRLDGQGAESVGMAAKAQQFIRQIQRHIAGHIVFKTNRPPTYEDLYDILKQIIDDEEGTAVNPLIAATVDAIKCTTRDLWPSQNEIACDNPFLFLTERALALIQSVVRHELISIKKPIGYEVFKRCARFYDGMDIFSLNHDLLMEIQLENDGVEYSDGFSDRDGDLCYYNESWAKDRAQVRLYKLHGSIDWYLTQPKNMAGYRYAKIRKTLPDIRDRRDEIVKVIAINPEYLTGNRVKELAYGHGVYVDLFKHFRHRLRKHSVLVCSGYGWGDDGINSRILQWLYERPINRLIVFHEKGEMDLLQKPFWKTVWDPLSENGKVRIVEKWLADCSPDDIQKYGRGMV
jgi:hypothetical protein